MISYQVAVETAILGHLPISPLPNKDILAIFVPTPKPAPNLNTPLLMGHGCPIKIPVQLGKPLKTQAPPRRNGWGVNAPQK